jgi:hypothetical protein
MISGLHGLIKDISVDFCETVISESDNAIIFGIGCTVATELTKTSQNQVNCESGIDLVPPTIVTNPIYDQQLCKLSNLKYLQSSLPKKLITTTVLESMPVAFTVINIEQPPFVKLCSQPHKWFKGAPSVLDVVKAHENENCIDSEKDIDVMESDSSSDESEIAVENLLTGVEKKKNVMYPNVAVSCKSHITYPGFGGILPFAMQSTTIETRKHLLSSEFLGMSNVVRTMCYNVSGRLATGEYNVPMKTSTSVGRVHYDISGTSDNAAFNMKSCMDRQDTFTRNNQITLKQMSLCGSPARIEIAFASPSPALNNDVIIKGMFIFLFLLFYNFSNN